MSNWEPEEVSDADMEGIAGGAGRPEKPKGPKPKPPEGKPDGVKDETKPKAPGTGFEKK